MTRAFPCNPVIYALLMALTFASPEGGQAQSVANDEEATPTQRQFTALAQVVESTTRARSVAGGVDLTLGLSQPVPWRAHTLDEPPRLVLDFAEVDFARLAGGEAFLALPQIAGVRAGPVRDGWSRLVLLLSGPYGVDRVGMRTETSDGSARLELALRPVDAARFAAAAGPRPSATFGDGGKALRPLPRPESQPLDPRSDGRFVVVIDPGHGGIDPGAVRDGVTEAELVLRFARELQEQLRRSGTVEAVLTRSDDSFVPLETRIALARRAGADLFLSIHADAIAEGIATGAQVYTISDEASSRATAQLAERHDREDLLAGVDLSHQDDEVAEVLMSMAQIETRPRTDALAKALIAGLEEAGVQLHKVPLEAAGFSVLKSPDVPSALVEIGFLSSPSELTKLQSVEWRAKAQAGLVAAIRSWWREDAARAALIRQ
ncbi:MAG: N-acetylmuramoyl-L-alanine amidase [Celeribacter sp.]|jgi:N-acetylmuramoyl-L-alanine amidase